MKQEDNLGLEPRTSSLDLMYSNTELTILLLQFWPTLRFTSVQDFNLCLTHTGWVLAVNYQGAYYMLSEIWAVFP